jgi:hypothetical protein
MYPTFLALLIIIDDDSNHNRTGWLAATDNLFAFLPLPSFANLSTIQKMSLAVNRNLANMTLTPLQKVQYAIQESWFLDSSVPQTEIIILSKGLIAPASEQAYLSTLSSVQVKSPTRSNYIDPLTSFPASFQPWIGGQSLRMDCQDLPMLTLSS